MICKWSRLCEEEETAGATYYQFEAVVSEKKLHPLAKVIHFGEKAFCQKCQQL